MKCKLCGNDAFVCIHNGTRDIPELNAMKCTQCGLVQLDGCEYNTELNYVRGGMLENTYSVTSDRNANLSWETWINETARDDNRRYETLKEVCQGKRVLEFGCGNGEFLRKIKDIATDVTGIELMEEARNHISREGIKAYKSLRETKKNMMLFVCLMLLNT